MRYPLLEITKLNFRQARDQDGGQYGRITYHLGSDSNRFGYFDIDSESGIITTAKSFR